MRFQPHRWLRPLFWKSRARKRHRAITLAIYCLRFVLICLVLGAMFGINTPTKWYLFLGWHVHGPFLITGAQVEIVSHSSVTSSLLQPEPQPIQRPGYMSMYDRAHPQTVLPRKWRFVQDRQINDRDTLRGMDSNTCVWTRGYLRNLDAKIVCMPSLLFVGFEKCATTELSQWLGYHPNILAGWTEVNVIDGKNYKHITPSEIYHKYAAELPGVPGGARYVGRYWTAAKSPSYAAAQPTPRLLAQAFPNVRLLFCLRDPVKRAYSHYSMFARMHRVILHIASGTVRIGRFSGKPGEWAPPLCVYGELTTKEQVGHRKQWRWLDEADAQHHFHDFVVQQLPEAVELRDKLEKDPFTENFDTRTLRIVQSGFYGFYLERYLHYFAAHQIVLSFVEDFWKHGEAAKSILALQKTLGLPLEDYSNFVSVDTSRGKETINNMANLAASFYGFYGHSAPMEPRTVRLLQDLYKPSNKKLQGFLSPEQRLPPSYAT
eukprot:m.120834 g.120834  ORF g.120834 m.120834 type:complete len:489 (-) comp14372_c0_seq6:1987-3453(-)